MYGPQLPITGVSPGRPPGRGLPGACAPAVHPCSRQGLPPGCCSPFPRRTLRLGVRRSVEVARVLASPSLARPTGSHDGDVADPPDTGEWTKISEFLLLVVGGHSFRRDWEPRHPLVCLRRCLVFWTVALDCHLVCLPVINDVGPLKDAKLLKEWMTPFSRVPS